MLRATRDAEREVFAAFDPTDRDAAAADGGWSAGDIQAHLTAWKRRTVERLVAIREGGEEPSNTLETDEINAIFHAERAGWPWTEVATDADATTDGLILEVESASTETLALDRTADGGWPSRPVAYARYNLACFHALGGRLDQARPLLRQALAEQEELRTFAPGHDDLVALRAEIPALIGTVIGT